jgi:aminopeptidase N
MQGKESAHKYLKMQKRNIENAQPLIGTKDVYFHHFADNDIYYKGSWMLYTMRHVVNNDTLWFNTLYDYTKTFKYLNVTTPQTISFFSSRTRMALQPIFEQYLTQPNLPVFEYSVKENSNGILELRYRWTNTVKGFSMPIQVTLSKNEYSIITPDSRWRVADLNFFNRTDFKILTDNYLIEVKEVK